MHFDNAQYKQKGFALPLVLVGILVVGLVIGGAFYLKRSINLKQSSTQAIVSPSPAVDASREPTGSAETVNWKTYVNKNLGIEFKYPENYIILKEDNDYVEVSLDRLGEGLVTIANDSTDQFLNYKTLSSCKEVKEPGNTCLDEAKKWGQNEDLADDSINGIKVKSFYLLYNGPGITLHVFQTTENLSFSMSYPLFAEKYRKVQEQIIRTVKFLK